MKLFTVLFLCQQTLAQFDDCVLDYRSLENKWDQKLAYDLHNCYNPFKPPPTNGSQPLIINIAFTLNSFKFISEEQAFLVHGWTFISWRDDRLKWDQNKYDGIRTLEMLSDRIWIPHIKVINGIEGIYEDRIWNIPYCQVLSNGRVQCASWTKYSAPCRTYIKDWPYDAQNCTLKFGLFPETEIKLQLHKRSGVLLEIGEDHGAGWDLMGYERGINKTADDKHLVLKFMLKRHSDTLSVVLLYPSFVLTTLTFAGLLMDARRETRLIVLCFSLMCQFDFLSKLAEDISKHSNDTPKLLLFYRGSFIMTSVLIGVSFVLSNACRKKMPSPDWITFVNGFVYANIVKYTVWPRWDTKDVNEEIREHVKSWTDFANIVNSIWIVASILVYAIMILCFIPYNIIQWIKS